MWRILHGGLLAVLVSMPAIPAMAFSQTHEQIRQALIQQSIAGY